MSDKYRLITRSAHDGLECAVSIKRLDMIDDIKRALPKATQDRNIRIPALGCGDEQNTGFASGASDFCRRSCTNVDELMLEDAGGGHQAAESVRRTMTGLKTPQGTLSRPLAMTQTRYSLSA